MKSVVMVISGIPTSKGNPIGMAVIATAIEAVTSTTKKDTGLPKARKITYVYNAPFFETLFS